MCLFNAEHRARACPELTHQKLATFPSLALEERTYVDTSKLTFGEHALHQDEFSCCTYFEHVSRAPNAMDEPPMTFNSGCERGNGLAVGNTHAPPRTRGEEG